MLGKSEGFYCHSEPSCHQPRHFSSFNCLLIVSGGIWVNIQRFDAKVTRPIALKGIANVRECYYQLVILEKSEPASRPTVEILLMSPAHGIWIATTKVLDVLKLMPNYCKDVAEVYAAHKNWTAVNAGNEVSWRRVIFLQLARAQRALFWRYWELRYRYEQSA